MSQDSAEGKAANQARYIMPFQEAAAVKNADEGSFLASHMHLPLLLLISSLSGIQHLGLMRQEDT